MKGPSSLRKQAKFSQRILCSSRRILRSPLPSEKGLNQRLCGTNPVGGLGGISTQGKPHGQAASLDQYALHASNVQSKKCGRLSLKGGLVLVIVCPSCS